MLGHGRGCMDEVFAVRKVCEKYLANGKGVFWAFMDLEQAYDTIDRLGMWKEWTSTVWPEGCCWRK